VLSFTTHHRYCLRPLLLVWILVVARAGAAEKAAPPLAPDGLVAHFPDRVHAVVWRNWHAVEPERIAKVLGTSADRVCAMADSMGLPPPVPIPAQQRTRGYFFMTLCRRNWHLLPMDQLADLLETTPQGLMNFLQVEEHANWVILGSSKPLCSAVHYEPPSDAVRARATRIKEVVRRHFGDEIRRPAEPRFDFVRRLAQPLPQDALRAEPVKRLCSPRFLCSYLKIYGDPLSDPQIDMYPEGLLQRLAGVGVDGIWLYGVLRELAPGAPAFPEFGQGHQPRLANLRTLVSRAKRYGMGVYLYINEPRAMTPEFFRNREEMRGAGNGLCTSHPAVRQWLTDGIACVFQNVPDLAGVFTITTSENQTNCAWAGRGPQSKCPRCKNRTAAEIIAEVNAAIEAGVHRASPNAKVIVWDWGWNGHGDAPDVIALLPKSVYLMSVSEWSQPIVRGGVRSAVGEYAVSVVGPGPRALRQWAWARQAGLKTAAKVQLNTSWELSSLPYLPVLDLVAEHCRNLTATGVDAMMLTWSLGGYPSPNLEVAERFSRLPTPTVDEALDVLAQDRFGQRGAPYARRAWSAFSRAFQEYPYSIRVLYLGPMQLGPANLLYPKQTGWKATMIGFPYDDLRSWCPPYSAEVFAAQFETVAARWGPGLAELETAVQRAPAGRRAAAEAELRYARAAWLYFRSAANQARFILIRDALANPANPLPPDERDTRSKQLRQIVEDELTLSRDMYELAKRDSCIGFEAASQYFYLPLDLVEKVVNCQQILDQ